jgi:hypothetical protein
VYVDVQALPPGAYARAAAAAECSVRGGMLVPLFVHPDARLMGPVAVMELAQRDRDASCFPALFNWLVEKLPVRRPCTSNPDNC